MSNSVQLPKGFYIKYLGGKSYIFYYTKYDWEPSIEELSKSLALVYETINQHATEIGLIKVETKASVFVIDGDVCVGDEFTSNLKPRQMDDLIGLTNENY
jgi:hypothetical protein